MSSGYLLDTSVLSLLAPGRPPTGEALTQWIREHDDSLYISAITVAEVEQGICKLRRTGGTGRAEALTRWLNALLDKGSDRLLPFDVRAGRIAGELSDQAIANGRHPGFADVAIAAIAVAHGLVLLTCNSRHFAALGIAFSDPLEKLPD